jgi:hypothetical protein
MARRRDSTDHMLDALRGLGDGALGSVGLSVTVVAGSARVEGAIAREIDYVEYFYDALGGAARRHAESAEDENERRGAREMADALGREGGAHLIAGKMERRREIAEQLRGMSADDPAAEELHEEEERLGRLRAALVLRNARVWGPGYNPLHGPLDVPFVRIPVASIDAWWLGVTDGGE